MGFVRMGKTGIACATVAAMTVCGLPAQAFAADETGTTFSADGIVYTVTAPGQVSVGAQSVAGVDFASQDASVVIPSQVNGYEVTGINAYAFSNGSDQAATLSSVSIPSTVTTIGKYAFSGCSNLASVEIPSSVTTIDMYAFANCTSMKSLVFDDAQTATNTLVMGEGAFCNGSKAQGSLMSLEIPTRLAYIPVRAFQYQTALQKVTCSEECKVSNVGAYAFYHCEALKSLQVPIVTGKPVNTTGGMFSDGIAYAVGTEAFSGLNSLEELIFMGDENFALSDSDFSVSVKPGVYDYTRYTYSPIKTIVYYGDHTSSLYTGKSSSRKANHYQRISYYNSKQDMEAGQEAGRVFVRDDIALKNVATASGSDADGDLVYGATAPQCADGKAWYFDSDSLEEGASRHIKAYAVDTDDLSYGEVVLKSATVPYVAAPIELNATVLEVSGKQLSEGVDYAISVADAEGNAVDVDAIQERGEYVVTVTAMGSYHGSCSATLTVAAYDCELTRASGDAQYGTKNHEIDTAFAEGDADTVILVGKSNAAAGAAAGGLAGVRDAPLVVTEDGSLSLEAARALRTFKPESVLLVGIKDASAVMASVRNILGETVSISNAFEASSQALIANQLYTRTKSTGYWDDATTAYVANVTDVPGAALAGTWAYRTSCPVFLTEANGKLPAESAKNIAAAGFKNVVLVGAAASAQSTLESQLASAKSDAVCTAVSGDDAYAASAEATQQMVQAGLCSYDAFTLVSAGDTASAVTAVATCGKNHTPLLFADEFSAGKTAIEQVIKPNKYSVTCGYVFGPRCYLSGQFQDELARIWAVQEDTSLAWAKVELSPANAVADGEAKTPTVSVKAQGGKELVYDTDYIVTYWDDSNDAPVLAKDLSRAGDYTALIAPKKGSSYEGSVTAAFSITAQQQTIKLSPTSKKLKFKALKKAKKTLNVKVLGSQSKLACALDAKAKSAGVKVAVKSASKITVTVPKKCKKGSYKVSVTAVDNGIFSAASKTLTIKVA